MVTESMKENHTESMECGREKTRCNVLTQRRSNSLLEFVGRLIAECEDEKPFRWYLLLAKQEFDSSNERARLAGARSRIHEHWHATGRSCRFLIGRWSILTPSSCCPITSGNN
jgi:hypothetical protein